MHSAWPKGVKALALRTSLTVVVVESATVVELVEVRVGSVAGESEQPERARIAAAPRIGRNLIRIRRPYARGCSPASLDMNLSRGSQLARPKPEMVE